MSCPRLLVLVINGTAIDSNEIQLKSHIRCVVKGSILVAEECTLTLNRGLRGGWS
jgi:hypothetical protein